MELKDFTQQMNRMTSTWTSITNVDRMPRYYRVVKELPLEALKEIVDRLLDSSTKMPLPKDFMDQASEWRKNYFNTNGHVYGTEKGFVEADQIGCKVCFDCGIMKIEHHQPSEFKQLMRCSCEKGSVSMAKMPQWSHDVAAAFKKVAIDPKWFNPHANETEDLINSEKKLYAKVMAWRSIVEKSEIYWDSMGYK
jgi:hypothetical protein